MIMCAAVDATAADGGVSAAGPPVPRIAIPPINSAVFPAIRARRESPHPPGSLFDILFEDIGFASDGAVPIDFGEGDQRDDDSGVVSTAEISAASDERDHTRGRARCSPPSTSGSRARSLRRLDDRPARGRDRHRSRQRAACGPARTGRRGAHRAARARQARGAAPGVHESPSLARRRSQACRV